MNVSAPETWVLVAFFILVCFSAKRIYTSIRHATDHYSGQIAAHLEEAKTLHAEALALLKDSQSKHATALHQAEDILSLAEEEIKEFKNSSEHAYAEFQAQREKLFQEHLHLQKQEIIGKLRQETVDTALKIVERILKGDKKTRETLTKKAIEEMGEQFFIS